MYALITVALAADEGAVPVVVASRLLEPGTVLTADDLYVVRYPPDYVPDGTFDTVEELVGRVVREPMPADVLLRAERLADPELRPGVDALVPRGLRRVRLERPAPFTSPEPWDLVDVVRVDARGACVLAEAATVVAGERADGTLDSRLFDQGPYVALHLIVDPAAAVLVAATPPADVDLWLRGRGDVAKTHPPERGCAAGEP